MRKTLVVIFLIAVWNSSCDLCAEQDSLNVQHTVLRYTQLLTQGYAKMNMTPLQEVATEQQALKAYNHMSALGSSKIRMESELVDIEFLGIQFSEKETARAQTREKWNYTHVNIDTQMPSQTTQGLIYNLSYELVKKDGKWLVASVSVIGEDKPENASNVRPQ